MTNKTVILLIRRIDGPDGSFRGMVTVGIDPSFFRNSFKVALIRSGSTFAIFRSDATLLARHPHSDELEGKNFSHIPLFRDLLPKADSGIFSVVGALDHQPRIIHFRRIDRYPLVLNVSLNQTKLLAEWRENAARLGGGAMAAIVLVMALIAVIVRQLRRQEAQNMAIAESEAHYRALYNDTPVMLHSLGPDLKIVSVSEYWLKKMGYSREEVVGKRSVDFMAPESRDATLNESMPEFLRTGHVEDFPVQMLTSTGELRDMLLSSAAQRDPEGNFIQSLSVMVDVTERNRLTTALRRTLEELTRSNADLEQFAYVASHDLQEPLRMVSTYVQLLSRRYRGQLDNDADDFIAYAAEGAQRMSRMINELLDYSRIQSAAKPFETVDLNVVLKTVLDNLRIRIGEKKAVIEAMKLPSLPGDRTQLTSLMQNLIANAVKYSREGVIPLVKISVHQDGDYWKFAVTDNGIGIEPPYLEKIFRLFQRLHTRDTYEGTGIGLTVCRRIVERHGGRIWAESAGLGDGCSFIFTLPNEQATNP